MSVGLVFPLLNYATDIDEIWNSMSTLNVLGMVQL